MTIGDRRNVEPKTAPAVAPTPRLACEQFKTSDPVARPLVETPKEMKREIIRFLRETGDFPTLANIESKFKVWKSHRTSQLGSIVVAAEWWGSRVEIEYVRSAHRFRVRTTIEHLRAMLSGLPIKSSSAGLTFAAKV